MSWMTDRFIKPSQNIWRWNFRSLFFLCWRYHWRVIFQDMVLSMWEYEGLTICVFSHFALYLHGRGEKNIQNILILKYHKCKNPIIIFRNLQIWPLSLSNGNRKKIFFHNFLYVSIMKNRYIKISYFKMSQIRILKNQVKKIFNLPMSRSSKHACDIMIHFSK